jgi:CheY-like chemotaxis protein
MDGYETAKRILKVNPNQRIIFASAFGRETLESTIKNVGIVAEILQKPFDLDVLVDSVEDQFIYSKLQALKINVGDLKSWNPTHQQLTDLYDALLKLRDPKKVFSELLHESDAIPKKEKADIASHGEQRQKGDENRECRVITAILEDALGYLGPEWLSIFFFHLDHLGVRRENIADSPDQFVKALEKLLGSASSMVRLQIVKAIELNQDVVGQSDTILRFKKKLSEVACLPSTADGSGSGGGRNR